MREPPRLNTGKPPNVYSDSRFGGSGPSDRFGSDNPAGAAPGSRDFPPRQRSTGKTLAIAFGATFLVMFLICGGGFAWLYSSFRSASPMSAQYREHREPIGGAMSQEIVDTLNSAAPQAGDELASLELFLKEIEEQAGEDEGELLDYERIVKEIQESGLAVGINSLTRLLWIENLRGEFGLPELGDENCIVDVRWLIPGTEARVTVVSYHAWDVKPTVYLLYLTQASGRWKLFDFRDVLLPLSESQYFAAYSAAPMPLDSHYFQLSEELLEIYGEHTASSGERAQKTLQSFKRRAYPEPMLPLAQGLTADYLLIYQDVPTLSRLAAQLSGDSFAGAHYIQGRLALLQEDKAEASRCATELVRKVGWHPAAALLAAEAAESPEAQRQAADWLRRSLVLAPGHSSSVEAFFEVADDADLQRLLADLSARPDGQTRLVRLLARLHQPEPLRRLATLVGGQEKSALASEYLQMLVARDEGRTEAMLAAAAGLLRQPDIGEIDAELEGDDEPSLSTIAWELLLSATSDAEHFDSAWAAAPDRSEFLRRYRERIIERWYVETDWSRALQIFQQLPADSDLSDDPETRIAMGVCSYRLKNYHDAFEQLVEPIAASRDALLAIDSPPAYAYTWMEAAATAAVETERMWEFADALNEPELAFLILHSVLASDQRQAEAEHLQTWYREQPDVPPLWLEYYTAELAYARGDWPAADAALARAIEMGEADERLTDYDLPSLTYSFVPFSEDLSEWQTTRLERAFRCGRLSDLIQALEQQDLIDVYAPMLIWLLPEHEDVEAQLEVADRLAAEPDVDALAFVRNTRQHHYEKQGDYQSAIDLVLTAAKEIQPTDAYDGGTAFISAVELMTVSGRFERLEELRELAHDADQQAAVQALSALRAADAEQFSMALDNYNSDYYRQSWFQNVSRVGALQRAGLWDKVNQQNPADLGALAADYTATGLVVLDIPASEAREQMSVAMGKLGLQELTALPLDSFPQAVAAWASASETGRLIAVAYDEPPGQDQTDGALARLRDNYPGFICFAWLQPAGALAPTADLRRLAAGMGEALNPAAGYYDFTSQSWFTGPEWIAQLQQAISHGVNRRAPTASYLSAPDTQTLLHDAPNRVPVAVGLIVEAIPVRGDPNDSTAASPAAPSQVPGEAEPSERVSILERAPFLVPLLQPGTRVLE